MKFLTWEENRKTLNLVSTFNKETTEFFCVYVLKSIIKPRIKVTATQEKVWGFFVQIPRNIALHI